MAQSIYDFECTDIKGERKALKDYAGKVLLIVNTASDCGYTPQYKGLEKLYSEFQDQGLEILGFPCNQFLGQEPGTESDIQTFCTTQYQISFPLFAKVNVNGVNADPLYQFLSQEAKGLLGSTRIKWNFTKFLVNKEGKVIKRFATATKPKAIESDIKRLL